MEDDKKPAAAPVVDTANVQTDLSQPVEVEGLAKDRGVHTPGLSFSPGLRELPDSQVPGLAGGGMVSHVFGPGQAPVDPIAAGLDTGFDPVTRAANRVITQTGEFAAGPRPTTYAHVGGDPVPQAGPADHANIAAPTEDLAQRSPGPNSIGADEPTIVKDKPAEQA